LQRSNLRPRYGSAYNQFMLLGDLLAAVSPEECDVYYGGTA